MRLFLITFLFSLAMLSTYGQCCIREVSVSSLDELNTELDLMISNSSTTATTITIDDGVYESDSHNALYKQINTDGGCPCTVQAKTDNEVTLKGRLLWRMYNTKNLTIKGINFEETNANSPRGVIEMFPYTAPGASVTSVIDNVKIIDCNFYDEVATAGIRHYIQAINAENISIRGCNFAPNKSSLGHYLDLRNLNNSKVIGNKFSSIYNSSNISNVSRYISFLDVSNSLIKANKFSTKYKDGHYVHIENGVKNVIKQNIWKEEQFYHSDPHNKSYVYLIRGGHHIIEDNSFLDKYTKSDMIDIANLDLANPLMNQHKILNNQFKNLVLDIACSMIRIGNHGSSTIPTSENVNSGILVEGNSFSDYNNVENPLNYYEVISNKSAGNTYKNNKFQDCRGGLFLRCGDSITVDSNKFVGMEKWG